MFYYSVDNILSISGLPKLSLCLVVWRLAFVQKKRDNINFSRPDYCVLSKFIYFYCESE
jgi:hypothetical protein